MADIFFGQNTSFELISRTHGKRKLKFVEAFEVDPAHTNKKLYFFNTKEMLAISIFEGCNGNFGYLETEEKYFLSMIMDQDPTAEVINDDPGAYLPFQILLNSRNEVGRQRNGIFVKGARIAGVPESLAPREEQHSRVGFIAATRYKIKGGGFYHARVLAATPAGTVFQVPADDLNFDATGLVSLPAAFVPHDINIYDAVTKRNWVAVFKNGDDVTQEAIDNPGMFTVSVVGGVGQIQLPAAPAAADVWEFIIPYKATV